MTAQLLSSYVDFHLCVMSSCKFHIGTVCFDSAITILVTVLSV